MSEVRELSISLVDNVDPSEAEIMCNVSTPIAKDFIVIGNSGQGKTTVVRSLVQMWKELLSEEFNDIIRPGPEPVTTEIIPHSIERIKSANVRVFDTPGLNEPGRQDEVFREMERVLANNGVVLVCIQMHGRSPNRKHILSTIHQKFGHEVWKSVVIVLTKADQYLGEWKDSLKWYEKKKPNLGKKFESSLKDHAESIWKLLERIGVPEDVLKSSFIPVVPTGPLGEMQEMEQGYWFERLANECFAKAGIDNLLQEYGVEEKSLTTVHIQRYIALSKSLSFVIAGNSGVGKTSLVEALINQQSVVHQMNELAPGPDPVSKKITHYSLRVADVTVNVYDSPGINEGGKQEELITIINDKIMMNDSNGILILCFEMYERMIDCQKIIAEIHEKCGIEVWNSALIVLTKADKYPAVWKKSTQKELQQKFEEILEKSKEYLKKSFTSDLIGMTEDTFKELDIPILPTSLLKDEKIIIMEKLGQENWFNILLIQCCLREKGKGFLDINSTRLSKINPKLLSGIVGIGTPVAVGAVIGLGVGAIVGSVVPGIGNLIGAEFGAIIGAIVGGSSVGLGSVPNTLFTWKLYKYACKRRMKKLKRFQMKK